MSEAIKPMFYINGEAAKRLIKGESRFANATLEPKKGPALPLYIDPPERLRVIDAARKLVAMYLMNPGTDSEFIACKTPSKTTKGTGGCWDTWTELNEALSELEFRK